jgi:hypothetical protein
MFWQELYNIESFKGYQSGIMQEILLSVKQYKSVLDHLERIKNDVTILKQKSTGEACLVDTYDLVRLLQVTYRTIQRWRISGQLPFIRLAEGIITALISLLTCSRSFRTKPQKSIIFNRKMKNREMKTLRCHVTGVRCFN